MAFQRRIGTAAVGVVLMIMMMGTRVDAQSATTDAAFSTVTDPVISLYWPKEFPGSVYDVSILGTQSDLTTYVVACASGAVVTDDIGCNFLWVEPEGGQTVIAGPSTFHYSTMLYDPLQIDKIPIPQRPVIRDCTSTFTTWDNRPWSNETSTSNIWACALSTLTDVSETTLLADEAHSFEPTLTQTLTGTTTLTSSTYYWADELSTVTLILKSAASGIDVESVASDARAYPTPMSTGTASDSGGLESSTLGGSGSGDGRPAETGRPNSANSISKVGFLDRILVVGLGVVGVVFTL